MTQSQYLRLTLAVCALALLPALAAADNRKWYLAEGHTGPFFDEEILIANPGPATTITLEFFTQNGGAPTTHTLNVGAARRITVPVRNYVPNGAVSAIVSAPHEIIVERSMYWGPGSRRNGHSAAGVTQLAKNWYFAEGSTGLFQTYVLIANPSNQTATVQVRLLPMAGAPITLARSLAPFSRDTVWVNDVARTLHGGFAVEVVSNIDIIAERAMYWGNLLRGEGGGHGAVGATSLQNVWHFAEGVTGGGFRTFVLLGNPGATAADVTITFYRQVGPPFTISRTVQPGQRVNVEANTYPQLVNNSFGIKVESPVQPIVAERAVYWRGLAEGHATGGVLQPELAWGFAEGADGGHQGTSFDTYYLFSNPNATAVQLKATFLREDGAGIVDPALIIPANARLTLNPRRYPGLTHQKFAAFFESQNGVAFVAERAMYFGANFSGGGHASAGTPWTLGAVQSPQPIPAPTVTSVSPASGFTTGGTDVTIKGTNFTLNSSVSFGGTASSLVLPVDSTTIIARTPEHAAGPVTVTVTSNGQPASLSNTFTYRVPPPPPPRIPPGAANGPAIATYPAQWPFPQNMLGVIQKLAADRRDLLVSSCAEHGGNNLFMFEAVRRLRAATGSNRWGLNIKRGNQGLSQDVVTYYFGPQGVPMEGRTEVYIFDIIGGHCGSNPYPNWEDQTLATQRAGTIGRWTTWGQNF